MADVKITIKGEDQASAAFKSTMSAADRLEAAVGRLAQQDYAAREANAARIAYEKLSEGEKLAAKATADYADALAKTRAEQEKAAKAAEAQGTMIDRVTQLKNAIDMAAGAASTLKDINDQFFALGKEGANIRQTGESFDYLIKKVGGSSDLMAQLRAASGGTVDDLKLMSSTTTLLAGAQGELATQLANSTPRLMEIAKAANKLNPELGNTTFMYESLALGVKRAQPDILDNLGLTIKIGDANAKYAAQLGKSVQALTAEEQKVALLNATLEAGNKLIEQAGGNADSYADSIARMEAAQKNATDKFKSDITPAISTVANVYSSLADESVKNNTIWMRSVPILNGIWPIYNSIALGIDNATRKQADNTQAVKANTAAVEEQKQVDISYLDAEKLKSAAINNGWQEAERMTRQVEAMNGAHQTSILTTYQAIQATSEYEKYLNAVGEATAKVNDAQLKFNESFGNKAVAALEKAGVKGDKYEAALAAIDKGQGTVFLATKKANDQLEAAAKQYQQTGDISAFTAALDTNKGAWEKLDSNLQKTITDLKTAQMAFNNFMVNIAQANGFTATIYVDTVTSGKGGSKTPGTQGTGKHGGSVDDFGYATGGSFVIEPGYPNDSYPLGPGRWGSSGETVTITPAGQTTNNNSSITINQLVLPGVTNARQFYAELTQMGAAKLRAGASYAGG